VGSWSLVDDARCVFCDLTGKAIDTHLSANGVHIRLCKACTERGARLFRLTSGKLAEESAQLRACLDEAEGVASAFEKRNDALTSQLADREERIAQLQERAERAEGKLQRQHDLATRLMSTANEMVYTSNGVN
jgi:flagellar capping protein FliD